MIQKALNKIQEIQNRKHSSKLNNNTIPKDKWLKNQPIYKAGLTTQDSGLTTHYSLLTTK